MRSPCWNDVDYPVTQPFLPGPPAVHCGIDIGCPSGTIIYAARAGVVERVQTGMTSIHVDGSDQRDFYLHGYSLVVVGEHVSEGRPVIHSDTVPVDPRYPPTGPHLHFEVQLGFTLPGAPPVYPGHPLDPVPILTGGFLMALTDQQQQAMYQWVQDNHSALTRIELRLGTAIIGPNGQPMVNPKQPPPLDDSGGLTPEEAAQLAHIDSKFSTP